VNIDHLKGIRYRAPDTPLELARRARHIIDHSDRYMGWAWEVGDPVGNVQLGSPGAWTTFGRAVIEAAALKMPRGGCRWCVARSLASVHRLPTPNDTPAVRQLLGQPCDRCLRSLQPRPPVTPRTTRRLVRRPAPPGFTASQVAHPTPVRSLRPTEKTVAAMRRMGVRPESYFGAGFHTVEDDAKLGAFVRRLYPGRGRKR
jgi:hypothetical protein